MTPSSNSNVYAEPFRMRKIGRALYSMLLDHMDRMVPQLSIGADRKTFYPGYSFEGLVGNAFRDRRLARMHAKPSGSVWFEIILESTGESWAVRYELGDAGLASVSTPRQSLLWVHETRGLAMIVIRPLFLDWMLEQALIREFGPEYLESVDSSPRLGHEFRAYKKDLANLYKQFNINS